MTWNRCGLAVLGWGLACSVTGLAPGVAQEQAAIARDTGVWRAASTTAKGVTGDLILGDEKLTLNFTTYPLAQIRLLKPEEVAAAFPEDGASAGGGNLYRVSIPAEKRFLHKNTLCGSEETQWVVTHAVGKSLHLAMFSGPAIPVFTPEALATTTDFCGTYTYVR